MHNRDQQSSNRWCLFDADLQLLGWRLAFAKPCASPEHFQGGKVWTQSTETSWDHNISLLLRVQPNCMIGQHFYLKPKMHPLLYPSELNLPTRAQEEKQSICELSPHLHTHPPSGLRKPMNVSSRELIVKFSGMMQACCKTQPL